MLYRRIAIFGGVYNNHLALAATLQDARRRGAEALFCLGDLGGFGPHPDRIYPLLRQPDVQVMRGNYDISLAEGLADCGCGYTDPRDNYFAQISYVYTFEHTSEAHKRWLRTLPDVLRVQLGRYRLHMCHGSPRQVNEFLWESTTPDCLLEAFCRDYQAEVLLCTHTGIKWHRPLPEACHAVNVGVIGRPENTGETHVWYALLTADPTLRVEFVPVHYDYQALAREMRQVRLPAEFVETILTGWWTTCLEILPGKERARGRW
jgi:diadenosine tetraphosphatase ApaH/serine/threonine PP2A family protein phosphatase